VPSVLAPLKIAAQVTDGPAPQPHQRPVTGRTTLPSSAVAESPFAPCEVPSLRAARLRQGNSRNIMAQRVAGYTILSGRSSLRFVFDLRPFISRVGLSHFSAHSVALSRCKSWAADPSNVAALCRVRALTTVPEGPAAS
jgi:hypothetical protein